MNTTSQSRNKDIITADLVKQRYELQKLTGLKSEQHRKEMAIYQSELNRIKCKQGDEREQYRNEHGRCLAEYMTLVEKKNKLESELARLETLSQQGEQETLDRRKEYRRAIAKKNAADFTVRNENNQLDTTYAEVKNKIADIDAYLAQYPEFRRQINEDYYNWQQDTEKITNELEQLTTLAMDLTLTGRKVTPRIFNHQARLQKIVAELETDIRQKPETRYQELDKSMDAHRNQKRILENKLRQLETQISDPTSKNIHKHTIVLPPYYREDVETYKLVKKQHETYKRDVCDLTECIAYMHNRLKDLSDKCDNPDYMSLELQQQHGRAHERLHRVTARLDSEYNHQISEVNARILELETELASSNIQDTINEPSVNKVSTQTATHMQTNKHEHQHVIPIKNRRELKMAQIQAMSSSAVVN